MIFPPLLGRLSQLFFTLPQNVLKVKEIFMRYQYIKALGGNWRWLPLWSLFSLKSQSRGSKNKGVTHHANFPGAIPGALRNLFYARVFLENFWVAEGISQAAQPCFPALLLKRVSHPG
jgi:hypothetical protein